MDFSLNSDQTTLATALDTLAARFEHKPTDAHGFALVNEELEWELAAAEFFDIAAIPELGAVAAAMAAERLARLPCTAEIALSMLLRPHLAGEELPRPFALVENRRPGRFVASAKTIVLIEADSISIAHPKPEQVEGVDALYAYPMGRLRAGVGATPLSEADAKLARKWIRVALAAEIAGLISAALASTIEHLSVRKQFGRPLGAFQALRHRMAECAVLAGGVRWLALKAAFTADDGDAALAALYAQDSATRVVYDLHQMLGAMGVTLEHPLHLWTYRLKALVSELGGRSGQASAAAMHCFEAI